MKKISNEDALREVIRVNSIESASCNSVYVGTQFGRRCLIHRIHDLAGCDHIAIGVIDDSTEKSLEAFGVEIR